MDRVAAVAVLSQGLYLGDRTAGEIHLTPEPLSNSCLAERKRRRRFALPCPLPSKSNDTKYQTDDGQNEVQVHTECKSAAKHVR